MSLESVIRTAELEVGKTEFPAGSNNVLYNTIYYGREVSGDKYPWCVTFLWWVFSEAGESKAFFNGGKTASCTRLMELYKAEGRWFTDGNYQRGDIPIMTFNKKREVQHCGLILGKATGGGWLTVEGNTSPGMEGSQDRGGSVALKTRHDVNILGCCRPNYAAEPEVVDDWSHHHAAEAIRWGIEMGLLHGYPDGTIRPDENVPLWRLMTILKRYDEDRFGGE